MELVKKKRKTKAFVCLVPVVVVLHFTSLSCSFFSFPSLVFSLTVEAKDAEVKELLEKKDLDLEEMEKRLRDQERERQSEILKLQMEVNERSYKNNYTSSLFLFCGLQFVFLFSSLEHNVIICQISLQRSLGERYSSASLSALLLCSVRFVSLVRS